VSSHVHAFVVNLNIVRDMGILWWYIRLFISSEYNWGGHEHNGSFNSTTHFALAHMTSGFPIHQQMGPQPFQSNNVEPQQTPTCLA